jgi:thiamine pyrophosphokinase
MIRDSCVLEGEAGQTVSLFPFSSAVTGITLRGFAYPLENNAMESAVPTGSAMF